MAKPLLEEVLHELNILHGLWVTDKLDASSFQIDTVPLIKKVETVLSKKPIVDELNEALAAILHVLSSGWYLPTRLPGKGQNARAEALKLYNQAEKALARYQEEVGDAETV